MPVLKLPGCQLASQIYHDRTSCHVSIQIRAFVCALSLPRHLDTPPKGTTSQLVCTRRFIIMGDFAYAKHDFDRTILALCLVGVSSNQVFYYRDLRIQQIQHT